MGNEEFLEWPKINTYPQKILEIGEKSEKVDRPVHCH